jgi:predicted outer membrane repeat protein
VTDLTDNASDPGSIRSVVAAVDADSTSTTDVIDLTGLKGAIVLSNGVLAIGRTGPVVIIGPGAGALTISGNHASEVFSFGSGPSSLSGLTIANGLYSYNGGGIYNAGALSIFNCAFTGDTSTGDSSLNSLNGGGAIYNYNGTLLVSDSSFTSNTGSLYGSAITNNGTLLVSGSSFTSNTATNDGGAICSGGQATIVDSSFTNNSASEGGAIFETGNTSLLISGSSFSNNSAGQGGAIYSGLPLIYSGCLLIVSNTTFNGNTATNGNGGGIYADSLNLSSSTFHSNSATDNGGGAYFFYATRGSSITVTNSTITGNSAVSGGGFYIQSGTAATVSMLSSIVVGNTTANSGTPNDVDIGAGSLNTAESAYDLIGTGGSGGLVQGMNFNQVGVSVASAGLSAFANYGGPTSTIALLSGSPALQAGSSTLTTATSALMPSFANNTFPVADATFLAVGQVIAIDNEQMQITAISGTTLTVLRGYNNTTVAAHASGASLTPPADQRGFPRSVGGFTDVGAFEQSVPNAPIVLADPVSTKLNAGQTAAFTVVASGSPTPTVRWQVNAGSGFTNITDGGAYSGSATTTLTITGVSSAMMGNQYQAVLTNSNGSATTTAATLLSVDSILTQPANRTINIGQNTTFTAASAVATDTVQWQVSTGYGFFNVTNGAVYGNVTTKTLTITGATGAMNGYQYRAVFANVYGTLTTSSASLAVGAAPAVTTQPVNETVDVAGATTITAAASGSPVPTVQWYVNTNDGTGFNPISGAVSTTLTLINVTASQNNDQYEAVFTNGFGAVTTNAVALTVTPTSQMTPVVTWANLADIMDGTPLSSTQLDATANVPGTFNYIPAAGTVLPVGQNQSLFVVFTPTDSIDYIVAGASADINVDFGPAAKLTFLQQPLATSSGTIIAPPVVVAVEDAAGTTLPNDSSTVTLTISSGTFAGGGTTVTAQAVNGVATFSNLAISNNGTYSLTASDGSLTSAVSNSFSIGATAFVNFNDGAADFTSQFNRNVNAGSAVMSWNATAGIDDQTNTTPGGGIAIANGPSDETAVYAPTTFNLSDGNVHTVSMFLTAAAGLGQFDRNQIGFVVGANGEFNGGYSFISARIYGNDTIQFQTCNGAGQAAVTVGNPVFESFATGDWLQLVFSAQETSSGTFTLTMSILDYGPTGAAVPKIVIAPVSTSVSGLNSIGTGSAMFAGFRTSLNDYFTSPLDLDNFAVDLPPARTAYLSPPGVAVAGVAMGPLAVAVEDSDGNIVVGDSSTVTLTLNQGTFAGGGTSVSAIAVDGIATFNNLVINTPGSYILTATDANPNLTSSAAALTVDVATTTSVTSNPVGPLTANEPVTFMATIAGGLSVGTVAFYAGPGLTNEIGSPVSVSGGTATSSLDASLSAGAYTITAVYSGGPGIAGSQGTLSVTVNLIEATSVVANQDFIPVNGASISSGVATLQTDGNSGFTAGDQIVVGGFTGAQAGFDGTYTIATVSGSQITYDDSNSTNVSTTTFNAVGYAISANTTSDLLYAATSGTANSPTGAQRSMVDSIAYTFNTPVNLAAGAVTLGIGAGTTSGEQPATATPNVVLTPLNGGTIWVVTFASNSNATVTGHSIADGIYTATLNSSLVTAVSGGAAMATTRPTDTFYRLFGDVAASGHVNSTDSGMLNLSFGLNYLSSSGYLDYFDYLGAGRVNSTASGELNLNFGSFWRGFTATI